VLIAGKWLLPVGVLAGTAAAVTSLVRPPAGRLALES
jgi:hypothetical protein